ncbi:MAG: acetate kinase [Phyllobacteriaceae bacterium]|nr:acetate kinase [Phyllobacteriaceae bacterium]
MILTLNCGSSSLKYQLFDGCAERVLAKGLVSRIGETRGRIEHRAGAFAETRDLAIPDHAAAVTLLLEMLGHAASGFDLAAIDGVGHRVVHGGDAFCESVTIDEGVIAEIEAWVPFAPLHNPANLIGIREAMAVFPNATHTAVFDTAFHQTMPPEAYVYPLPWELYARNGIRRFGFHGTSCRWVAGEAATLLGRPLDELKLIVCHLGNGCTIDAIEYGRSIDPSLGFGTVSGVMMGTRSGDFDPVLILHLARSLGMDLDAIDRLIHKQSGLVGIAGVGNDMRDVIEGMEAGNPRCRLAFAMFCRMVRKYVGAYAAVMDGVDAVVFTAGIGENCARVRAEICRGLSHLGLALDERANEEPSAAARSIGRAGAAVAALVVPTDEERMIALDTSALMRAGQEGLAA